MSGHRFGTIVRAWIFFLGLAVWVLAAAVALSGRLRWALVFVALALGLDAAGRAWSRRSPVPMPYFMRLVLSVPRGPHSPHHLKHVLQPRNGERILEVGPGIGVHALSIASSLLPDGVLDVLDVQKEMIEELKRRAASEGLTNIVATQGDAQALPYRDHTFDAAYMIGVLGEIPDAIAALRELARVLKSEGRLVICELLIDPDFVPLRTLREKASDVGFVFERSAGPGFAYTSIFRLPVA
ncbi:MAG TPA: methyltransferase domain-containing protein [Candidatus Methylomirabilis sp.]|nr:methyltransferase domain-containing protein [Candidatus Methylomirabilis sp.]